jgi:hypothetical protein
MRRDQTTVTIKLPLSEAETLSHGLSDLLCWCNGFMAASGDSFSYDPMGVEAARTLNLKLKSAMNAADDEEPTI